MRSRSAVTVTSGANRRPPLGEAARSSMARSTSPSPWIWATIGSTASAGATLSNSCLKKRVRRIVRVEDQTHAGDVRRHLFEQFQEFPDDGQLEQRESGDVFSRMRQARHHSGAERIASSCHDDRKRARHLLEDWDDAAADGDDGVRLALEQARGIAAHHFHVVRGPTLIELDFAALDPSEPLQRLLECAHPPLHVRLVFGIGHQRFPPGAISRPAATAPRAATLPHRQPEQ